jgi:hypothetical protein
MLQMFQLDVVKVDLVLHMLQLDSPAAVARAQTSRCGRGSRGDVSVPRVGSGGTGPTWARETEMQAWASVPPS